MVLTLMNKSCYYIANGIIGERWSKRSNCYKKAERLLIVQSPESIMKGRSYIRMKCRNDLKQPSFPIFSEIPLPPGR